LTGMLRCKFVAAQPPLTLMSHDELVNGGRAEPKTEAMRSESVLAAQSISLTSNDGGEVDVPRFELGASTMPR